MAPTPTPEPRATLHLVCGLPGAGKSGRAARLSADTGAVRLSPDDWLHALGFDGYDVVARDRVEALQWRLAETLLARGVDVVLDNGFWVRAERDRLRARAAVLGAAVRLHFLDVPLAELKRRVAARNAAAGTLFAIDPDDLDGWYAAFDRPGPDELG